MNIISVKFSGEIFDSMMKIYIFYLFIYLLFKMNTFNVKFSGEIFESMMKIFRKHFSSYFFMCSFGVDKNKFLRRREKKTKKNIDIF